MSYNLPDADASATGQQVSVSPGQTPVVATITSDHGAATRDYTFTLCTSRTAPPWTVSVDPAQIAEGGSATVSVSVPPENAPDTDRIIVLTAGGAASESDYSLPETLVLGSGETSATGTRSAVVDDVVEGDETVIVSARYCGENVSSATVTITASD